MMKYSDLRVGMLIRRQGCMPSNSSAAHTIRIVGLKTEGEESFVIYRDEAKPCARGTRISWFNLSRCYELSFLEDSPEPEGVEVISLESHPVDAVPVTENIKADVGRVAIMLARIIGADGGRRVLIESRWVSRLVRRRHAHVLENIANIIKMNGDLVESEFRSYSYRARNGKKNPCYLMTVDGFRALLAHGDTREAEIVRTAERQLNGELGRGEDTEATRVISEARGLETLPRLDQALAQLATSTSQLINYAVETHRLLDSVEARVDRLTELPSIAPTASGPRRAQYKSYTYFAHTYTLPPYVRSSRDFSALMRNHSVREYLTTATNTSGRSFAYDTFHIDDVRNVLGTLNRSSKDLHHV